MNKIDLFAEKLPRSPLGDYFPDYTGGDNYDAACDYLLHRFVSLNQSAATKQIYAHYTCATDTQQIKCEHASHHQLLDAGVTVGNALLTIDGSTWSSSMTAAYCQWSLTIVHGYAAVNKMLLMITMADMTPL